MSKRNKHDKVSDKTDSRLAGNLPTANSEEFVPKTLDTLPDAPSMSSNDVYDFIPKIKANKYNDKNNPVT